MLDVECLKRRCKLLKTPIPFAMQQLDAKQPMWLKYAVPENLRVGLLGGVKHCATVMQ